MERRDAYPTDTQHLVNLSGYAWASTRLAGLAGMRVLDLACGTGYGSQYLAHRARLVIGVDRATDVVATCRTRYPDPRVRFVAMDGTGLALKDGVFDAVISQDTIEHIAQDGPFVDEIARVLRRDGVLVLFTPHGKALGRVPEDPYHVREYTPQELQALLSARFRSIRWYGRRQGRRLLAAERHMDSVRQLDPLGLRQIVPRPVRHWIGGLVSRLRGGTMLHELNTADIEYVEGVAPDTNLIAVCVK